jgi:GntR family transcriptional regulator
MLDWHLQPQSDQPLHAQLEQRILEEIKAGRLNPGDKLPAERALSLSSNVSRATVRQAISNLVHQNVLERIHGSGTYVKQHRLETPLDSAYSFADQVSKSGLNLESQLLTASVQPAAPRTAHLLNLSPGDDVVYLERLRRINNKPFIFSAEIVPYMYGAFLLHKPVIMSLYRAFLERFSLPIVTAVDTLEATSAEASIADYLEVARGHPIMYVTRVTYTRDRMPLHLGHNYIRGDMCRFRSDLSSRPNIIEVMVG